MPKEGYVREKGPSQRDLESRSDYCALAYFAREVGALDTHIVEILREIIHIDGLKPYSLRNFSGSRGMTRDEYHAYLKTAVDVIEEKQKDLYRSQVGEWMSKHAPEKYWQYEPLSAGIVHTLLSSGDEKRSSLGYVAQILSLHFDSPVDGGTLREVIKHAGNGVLVERLKKRSSNISKETIRMRLEELEKRLLQKPRVRSEWARQEDGSFNARHIGLALVLKKEGVSPAGIAFCIQEVSGRSVPVVSMKYFLNSWSQQVELSEHDHEWIQEHVPRLMTLYTERKQKRYIQGARNRMTEEKRQRAQDLLEATFMKKYRDIVLRIARKTAGDTTKAEDIAQEVFVRLLRALRQGTLRLEPEKKLFGYIQKACRSVYVDMYARKNRGEVLTDPQDFVQFSTHAREDVFGEDSERAHLLESAIRTLPKEQAEIITYLFFEDLSQEEVAQKLGIPLGTVKSRARLAYQKIRTSLSSIGYSLDEI